MPAGARPRPAGGGGCRSFGACACLSALAAAAAAAALLSLSVSLSVPAALPTWRGAGGGSGGGGLQASRGARRAAGVAASALLQSLERAARAPAAQPRPHERLALLWHTMALTGHPPLLAHGSGPGGAPNYEAFGLPAGAPVPAFYAVDPHDGAGAGAAPADSPLRYVVRTEDAIRDLAYAVLSGRGGSGGGGSVCRASSVTRPFPCLASLRQSQPARFGGAAGGGAPRPAAQGGPLVVDLGFTTAGYYASLAAALGVSGLALDTQPQCAMWARVAARAGGADVTAYAAVPLPPEAVGRAAGAAIRAPVRTGCLTTSTLERHAARADIARWQAAPSPPAVPDAHGEAAAVAARTLVGTEGGGPGSLHSADGDTVDIPLASGDDLLCAVYGSADFCGGGGGGGGGQADGTAATAPAILLMKIDARGHEAAALDGLARTLASPAAPLNIVIELNKQRTAATLGLPSAAAAGAPAAGTAPSDDELVVGAELDAFTLSPEDNALVAERYVALVQRLLRLGYEVLSSDRGWFAAQDPWTDKQVNASAPLHDGTTLRSWADKAAARGEIDVWAYKPGEGEG